MSTIGMLFEVFLGMSPKWRQKLQRPSPATSIQAAIRLAMLRRESARRSIVS